MHCSLLLCGGTNGGRLITTMNTIIHATERVTMTSLRPRNLEQKVARPSLMLAEEGVVWGRDC